MEPPTIEMSDSTIIRNIGTQTCTLLCFPYEILDQILGEALEEWQGKSPAFVIATRSVPVVYQCALSVLYKGKELVLNANNQGRIAAMIPSAVERIEKLLVR